MQINSPLTHTCTPPPQGNWPPEWQRIQSRDEMGLRTGCMGICIAAKGDNQEVRVQPHRGGAGTHERLCAQTHSQCICMHTQTNGHTQQQIIGEMKFWVWALSFLNRHSSPPKRDKSKNSLLKPPKLDEGWKDIHMNYILCFIIMHLITHPNHCHCVYYDCFLLTYDQTILVNQAILVKSLKWHRKKFWGFLSWSRNLGNCCRPNFILSMLNIHNPPPLCVWVWAHILSHAPSPGVTGIAWTMAWGGTMLGSGNLIRLLWSKKGRSWRERWQDTRGK